MPVKQRDIKEGSRPGIDLGLLRVLKFEEKCRCNDDEDGDGIYPLDGKTPSRLLSS